MKKNALLPIFIMLLASCSSSGGSNIQSSSQEGSSTIPSSEPSETKLDNIDYVKLYSPSNYNYVYIWDGNNKPCGEWPGTKMSSFDSNWYTYDMKTLSSFNVIFHDNKGDQTADLTVNQGVGHYFYLNDGLEKRTTLPGNEPGPSSSEGETYPLPDNKNAYKNYYQLLVYSFADSDGNGIGDFKGIANKLSYLKNLGIEAIWLSPINPCTSYHAYDVTDYYGVNPDYVANGYTINNLIQDAHAQGIEIVLDLVLNHTSYSHPWYNEHSSWYGNDNKFGMPEFNFDNKEVREEMKKIGKYWLNQGVDGFRLDAAMWVYNSGTNRHIKNYAWWNEWCSALRTVKDDVYIIAEVLDSNHDYAYEYAQGGFNSTFDFEAMKHVYNAVKNKDYDYVNKTKGDLAKATKYNPNYVLGRPLSNHDVGRFSDDHNDMGDAKAYYLKTLDELRLANSINILTPGNTFMYYGDELGLQGTCPQGWDDMKARTPMPFKTNKTDSVKYFKGFKGNGVTTSTTLSGKSAEEDASHDFSLYSACSKLLNLKINHPTIKSGTLNKLNAKLPDGLKGYTINGAENIAVVYNLSSQSVSYNFTGNNLYSSNLEAGDTISIPSKGLIVYSY